MKAKSTKSSISSSQSNSQQSQVSRQFSGGQRIPLAEVTSEIEQQSLGIKNAPEIENPEDIDQPLRFKLDLSVIIEKIVTTDEFYLTLLSNYLKKQNQLSPLQIQKEGKKEFDQYERSRFLNWLLEISGAYKFNYSTFFLTASIIDEYQKRTASITKSNLHLIGACCIYLASKFNDVQPLSLKQIVDITYNHFTKEVIQEKELGIFSVLEFELNFPNAFLFLTILLRIFLKQVKEKENDIIEIAYFTLKLCTFDYSFQREYSQSDIAAGCITYATFLIFQAKDRVERNQLVKLLNDLLKITTEQIGNIGTEIENNVPKYLTTKETCKSFSNLIEQSQSEIKLLQYYNDLRN